MRATSLKAKKQQRSISFVGKYEVTVLTDRRIILPTNVRRQLRDHSIERLFPGKLPGLRALVLCPENLWSHWVNSLKKSFPCLGIRNGARTFFIPWQPVSWDTKGRITLSRRAREYAGIKANESAIIIGTDFWFELWSEIEFDEIIRECEVALHRPTQPLLSTENSVPPKQD